MTILYRTELHWMIHSLIAEAGHVRESASSLESDTPTLRGMLLQTADHYEDFALKLQSILNDPAKQSDTDHSREPVGMLFD